MINVKKFYKTAGEEVNKYFILMKFRSSKLASEYKEVWDSRIVFKKIGHDFRHKPKIHRR